MDHDADVTALLERRLKLVGNVSAVNAEALKANQRICGLQMEMQRLELMPEDAETGDAGSRRAVDAALAEAETALAECERRIADLESEMEALDRRLSAIG